MELEMRAIAVRARIRGAAASIVADRRDDCPIGMIRA